MVTLLHPRSTLLGLDFIEPSGGENGVGCWRGEVFFEFLFQGALPCLEAAESVRLSNFEGSGGGGSPRVWVVDHGPSVVPADVSQSPSFQPSKALHAHTLCVHARGTFAQAFDTSSFPLDAHLLRVEVTLDLPIAKARFASEEESVWAPAVRHTCALPPSRAAALRSFDLVAAPQRAVFRTRPELSPTASTHSIFCLGLAILRRPGVAALAPALLPNFALGCAGLLARVRPSSGGSTALDGMGTQHTLLVLLLAIMLWGLKRDGMSASFGSSSLAGSYASLTVLCLACIFLCTSLCSIGVVSPYLDNACVVVLGEVWAAINVYGLWLIVKFRALGRNLGPMAPAALEPARDGNGGGGSASGDSDTADGLDAPNPLDASPPPFVAQANSALAAFKRGDFLGFLEVEHGSKALLSSPTSLTFSTPTRGGQPTQQQPRLVAIAAAAAAAVAAAAAGAERGGGLFSPARGPSAGLQHAAEERRQGEQGEQGEEGAPGEAAGAVQAPAPAVPAGAGAWEGGEHTSKLHDARVAEAARTNSLEDLKALLEVEGLHADSCGPSLALPSSAHGSAGGGSGGSAPPPLPGGSGSGSSEARGTRRRHKNTALMHASKAGHVEAIHLLLRHGATIDSQRERCGSTALLLAVKRNNGGAVRALLGMGSSPNVHGRGFTPLMWAVHKGHGEVAELLVAAGADVDAAREEDGTTALIVAAREGREGMVRLLLAHGADRMAANKFGARAKDLTRDRAILALLSG